MAAEPATSALTGNAGFLLSRVGTAIQAGFKELLAGWRLRPQQYAILTTLRALGEASQQQLCRALGIDSGNMVDLVDGLESLGYAQRRRDPGDRRRYLLALTELGRRDLTAVTGAAAEYTARFLQPLDESEQATLTAALTRLYAKTPEGQRMPPHAQPQPARAADE
jgi:DNA-binding MarR family transcriptional regulator